MRDAIELLEQLGGDLARLADLDEDLRIRLVMAAILRGRGFGVNPQSTF